LTARPAQATHAQIDAIWRIESARVIATVARMVRDVGIAEDLAQDAAVAALERWPATGVPPNPGAWLTATAKHRAIDLMRRSATLQDKYAQIARELGVTTEQQDLDAGLDDDIGDDLLSLMFACCHPILPMPARVALTLRMLGGLRTGEIARAFLVPEATLGQRISRAKRTLAEADVPFEVPSGEELQRRMAAVLEVVYLIFNEGYSATAGDDWMRPALIEEALRLGRVLAGLAPEEPEVHGLVALMELQASRQPARTGPGGEPVLLADQDRSRWDRLLVRRGLTALERAEALGRPVGSYYLQAAIAACHARATIYEQTDWVRIAALYELLARVAGSPVVELNRAVAIGMAFGPEAGLQSVDTLALAAEGTLDHYHLLPSIRGDLLAKLGRWAEARAEFQRAASMTQNGRERELLLKRAAACAANG
jgi:RNA polymerase sigma factor (sigma-70 family)